MLGREHTLAAVTGTDIDADAPRPFSLRLPLASLSEQRLRCPRLGPPRRTRTRCREPEVPRPESSGQVRERGRRTGSRRRKSVPTTERGGCWRDQTAPPARGRDRAGTMGPSAVPETVVAGETPSQGGNDHRLAHAVGDRDRFHRSSATVAGGVFCPVVISVPVTPGTARRP